MFAQLARNCEWQNLNGSSLALKPMTMAPLYSCSQGRRVSSWGEGVLASHKPSSLCDTKQFLAVHFPGYLRDV